MIGQPVVSGRKVMGHESRKDNYHWFFGNANCAISDLSLLFPQYHFRFLKQVHGADLCSANGTVQTGDAHYSDIPGEALVIQTADCLPILLASPRYVIAVHAGWRGLVLNILPRCLEFLKNHNLELTEAVIGPHIQAQDFEVGQDVADQLLAIYKTIAPDSPLPLLPHPDPHKKKINLCQIASMQIRSTFGVFAPVHWARESTFSSPEYHSFRRGKATDARQYSFIVRT